MDRAGVIRKRVVGRMKEQEAAAAAADVSVFGTASSAARKGDVRRKQASKGGATVSLLAESGSAKRADEDDEFEGLSVGTHGLYDVHEVKAVMDERAKQIVAEVFGYKEEVAPIYAKMAVSVFSVVAAAYAQLVANPYDERKAENLACIVLFILCAVVWFFIDHFVQFKGAFVAIPDHKKLVVHKLPKLAMNSVLEQPAPMYVLTADVVAKGRVAMTQRFEVEYNTVFFENGDLYVSEFDSNRHPIRGRLCKPPAPLQLRVNVPYMFSASVSGRPGLSVWELTSCRSTRSRLLTLGFGLSSTAVAGIVAASMAQLSKQVAFLVKLEALRESLALDNDHARQLESRFEANNRVLSGAARQQNNAGATWFSLGGGSFVFADQRALGDHLQREQDQLRREITTLERAILAKERELARLEFDYRAEIAALRASSE
ncbi:hypothetical protein FVE85_8236 [Porphyridium purpureum]|uniref:Signal peptidase complex subunit 2 n=1 Tax=Porphyridium purpureum TaxID=35688 RepID=A0A5J4YM20_PORPP|nr:hypothetical protein FVE85_8236 [Porphyridium purpureum]|eukprot:POR3316..scf244_11